MAICLVSVLGKICKKRLRPSVSSSKNAKRAWMVSKKLYLFGERQLFFGDNRLAGFGSCMV